MKISGSYNLPTSDLERAYNVLQDPAALEKCIPGCESLVKTGDNEYSMKMKMVLAALSGQFTGTVKIAEQHPPTSFQLLVEGSGKIGFMKGGGTLTLRPSGDNKAIEVAYDGDAQIGGTMAAVGQRLVDTTARMLIKKFFDKISENLPTEPRPSGSDR